VVFWSDPDGSARSAQIEVVNADGTARRMLAENGIWPTWSPDGSRILYTFTHGEPDGSMNEIWVMDADGSGPRKLADGFLSRGWSPDGEKILFSGHDGVTYLMNADGSGVTKLLEQPISVSWGFDWQSIRP
jgi:Tol biopolymer transport system component